MASEDSPSARLIRIETVQQHQGETLARVAVAVESMAIISERMANHIEDTKRMHVRLDRQELDIDILKAQVAETHTFYRDVKRLMFGLVSAALAGVAWLIHYWVTNPHP